MAEVTKTRSVQSSEETKPLFRGRIHQMAFIFTLMLLMVYIVASLFYTVKIGVCVYLLSQLMLYGVSSTYHLTKFKNDKVRRFFQKLDHSSIFLLISGTQTGVLLDILPGTRHTSKIVVVTWLISIFGIFKVFFFEKIVEAVDVLIYIIHGSCIAPFLKVIVDKVYPWHLAAFIMGGVLYISGGIIFGIRKPNLYPKVFGYHEVFHLLTVLANMCFLVPIISAYFKRVPFDGFY